MPPCSNLPVTPNGEAREKPEFKLGKPVHRFAQPEVSLLFGFRIGHGGLGRASGTAGWLLRRFDEAIGIVSQLALYLRMGTQILLEFRMLLQEALVVGQGGIFCELLGNARVAA